MTYSAINGIVCIYIEINRKQCRCTHRFLRSQLPIVLDCLPQAQNFNKRTIIQEETGAHTRMVICTDLHLGVSIWSQYMYGSGVEGQGFPQMSTRQNVACIYTVVPAQSQHHSQNITP